MRKSKKYLELNLDKDVKDNNTSIFKYINNQSKTKDNVGPLLNEAGTLETEHTEKAQLMNDTFIFGPHWQDQTAGISDPGDQGKGMLEKFFLVKKGWVGEHLIKLVIYMSMGPGRIHRGLLRQLMDYDP
ncbi:hypothetical protein DUI87_22395 [Hirundo rustica rustica]|uniref:Uncharacterized protein n=1 Tax=Hirundo rustica rustica TaxID=333673 RepID=A0A3M0JJY8_HIRRU|nr:hypothetical protein DUI87_22395 [Hirundo rustica rustica]